MDCTIGLLGDTYLAHPRSGDALAALEIRPGELWFANLEAPFSSAGDERRQHRAWPSGGGFKMEPALAKELRALTGREHREQSRIGFWYRRVYRVHCHSRERGNRACRRWREPGERASTGIVVERGRRHGGLPCVYVSLPRWMGCGRWITGKCRRFECIRPTKRRYVSSSSPAGLQRSVPTSMRLTRPLVRREVRDARERADVVVVSVHWGLSTG